VTRSRQFAPHPQEIQDEIIEDEGPSVKDKYLEAIRGFRPRRSDFHDKLAEAAGLGDNEEAELEQLVKDWRRLKHGS